MSLFDPNELTTVVVRVTPRVGNAGERLAIWAMGYGKAVSTHLWDIGVSRALSNTEEIDRFIELEQKRLGVDEREAGRRLVLRSGMYKLKENVPASPLNLPPELVDQINEAADREGVSVEEYLKSRLGLGDRT